MWLDTCRFFLQVERAYSEGTAELTLTHTLQDISDDNLYKATRKEENIRIIRTCDLCSQNLYKIYTCSKTGRHRSIPRGCSIAPDLDAWELWWDCVPVQPRRPLENHPWHSWTVDWAGHRVILCTLTAPRCPHACCEVKPISRHLADWAVGSFFWLTTVSCNAYVLWRNIRV